MSAAYHSSPHDMVCDGCVWPADGSAQPWDSMGCGAMLIHADLSCAIAETGNVICTMQTYVMLYGVADVAGFDMDMWHSQY